MKVKTKELGTGKPLICIPIVETTADAILEEANCLKDLQVDMIEWRVDYFEKIDDLEAVKELLLQIGKILSNQLVLFTYRSKRQGGNGMLEEADVQDLLIQASHISGVDFIDLEFFETSQPETLMEYLHQTHVKVVASHHDFQETPKTAVMEMLLHQMKEGGADLVKLAVMPNDMEDVVRLLRVTERFKGEFPNVPVITMSMGKQGMISRLSGEFFGSVVTFASRKKCSAPGQMPVEDLQLILEKIHHALEGE